MKFSKQDFKKYTSEFMIILISEAIMHIGTVIDALPTDKIVDFIPNTVLGLVLGIVIILYRRTNNTLRKVKDHAQVIHWLDNIRFTKISSALKEKGIDVRFFKQDEEDKLREKLHEKFGDGEHGDKTIREINDLLDSYYRKKPFWND